jgi:uncharacterized protein (DUF2267 family)
MTTARLDIIDRSVEKAHIWINDVAEELWTEDNQRAYRVLRAFLHALRDHLTVDEAAKLAAQLPIFVRGVFYEGWDPSRTPEHARDIDSFLTGRADERACVTSHTTRAAAPADRPQPARSAPPLADAA